MSDIVRNYLPWVMSAITIYMTVLAGNKTSWAWAIGLGNQVFWLAWIISVQAWGLLPMTAALTFVYARNHFKWSKSNPEPIAYHRDVLNAHAQFGGDLRDMQRRYDAIRHPQETTNG